MRKFILEGMDERKVVLKIGKSDHEAFHRVVRGQPEKRSRFDFLHPRGSQPLTILWRHAGHVTEIERKISRRSRST